MKKLILLIFLISTTFGSFSQTIQKQDIPVSTQWTIDASGNVGRNSIPYIYLIYIPKTGQKGTGFRLKTGEFITCAHVVKNARANEIIAYSAFKVAMRFTKVIIDSVRDLAILVPIKKLDGGFSLGNEDSLMTGNIVTTWGFPYGHNGPAPLLSVGYLSGFKDYPNVTTKKNKIKHLVVNGAFNPGNSGGPLFIKQSDKVIGIVVSKKIPTLSTFDMSAISALAKNNSGVTYTRTFPDGRKEQVVESQIVALLLQSYQNLTQVMIGEAISVSTLKEFLKENRIKY
jgi:S1-C subfamily serine protease